MERRKPNLIVYLRLILGVYCHNAGYSDYMYMEATIGFTQIYNYEVTKDFTQVHFNTRHCEAMKQP